MRKALILALSVLMLTTLAATTNGMTKARTTKVAVVTDQKTYEVIGNDIDAFTASMSFVGKEGVLIIDKWQHPDSLRAVLKHYYTTQKIEGAVLVGDIPIAMIRDAQHMTTAFKMDQRADWKDSSVPSDRFYDDFDLRFEYLKQDADKPLLHYYSLTAESAQTIGCDIWTSRIKPPKIPGTDKYSAIADYLKKAIAQKKVQAKKMSNILVYTGHGYNSDSYNARIDEIWTLREQFPFLGSERGADLDYINHDFEPFVREKLMNTLAQPRYDLAILHHHGSKDTQYLGATPKAVTIDSWVENIKLNLRQRIRRSKDTTATINEYMERYGIPREWFAGVQEFEAKDSTFYANMDINLPDMYGYRSGARAVILDACFNGAFNNEDYIAGYWIFNPGETMVVKANTVNTLQDTWTNELIGLLNAGVCFGNWAKGQLTLESHLFGDASFHFANAYPKLDLDKAMVTRRGDSKYWKKLLNHSDCDIRALAIKTLSETNAITSQELLDIQRHSESPVVRMEAFMSLKRRADSYLSQAIRLGIEDSYELLQRLSAQTLDESGDPTLKDIYDTLKDDPAVNSRVMFYIKPMRRHFYPTEKELEEYALLNSPDRPLKDKKFTVRRERNGCCAYALEDMFKLLQNETDQDFRVAIAEVFGWYVYSYKKNEIISRCEELLANEKDGRVAHELLKSINRLQRKN
jgi:hypothetical protein